MTKGGATTSYSYNTLGQRIRKTSGTAASTVIYAYDFNTGNLQGEYDSTGKVIKEYVWLGDIPVAVMTPNPAGASSPPVVYYVHADHLNTPRLVVDRNNAIRWRWMSEPFGTTAPEINPSGLGNFAFNLRMPGQYFDQESGLFYNHNRFLDTSTNRYSQSDPIGLAGGINTYTYVDGNPLSNVDPNGLWSVTVGAFPGAGAQVIFGQNPNGSGFMSTQFGWGIGGGFSYNPLGKQPGYEECQGASWGVGAGVYAQTSFRAGPIGAGAGANLGRNFRSNGSKLYGGFPASSSIKDRISGINASVSWGGQLTVFGGGTAQGGCTCGQ